MNKEMQDFLWDFFSFRKMVSLTLIKIIYILGVLLITLSSLGILFMDNNFWAGIISLILGNLLWRIVCESLILLFSIHQELVKISQRKKMDD